MTFKKLGQHDKADAAKGIINENFERLESVRLDWRPGFTGRRCRHNGCAYDLAEKGISSDVPGATASWDKYDPTEKSGARGTLTDLKALPVDTKYDYFIVEREPVSDGRDWDGEYWRRWVGGQYQWVR